MSCLVYSCKVWLHAYCLAYYFLTLVFIILLQLDESSTTTSGNRGRGRVNTPRSGGRSGGISGGLNTLRSGGISGGLNTLRSGRRSGGVDIQSQHVAIPPEPAPEPAIYEVESDTAPEPAIYELPSDTAPEHPSQPALKPVPQVALHSASQLAPETPSQPTSQPPRTTNRAATIRAATHYTYKPNVSIYYH
jgi:hypothetical protein